MHGLVSSTLKSEQEESNGLALPTIRTTTTTATTNLPTPVTPVPQDKQRAGLSANLLLTPTTPHPFESPAGSSSGRRRLLPGWMSPGAPKPRYVQGELLMV
jgi:hypothetical protein